MRQRTGLLAFVGGKVQPAMILFGDIR